MPDKISPARRSANMSRIRSKNTRPEMVVRRLLHRLGYRFRLHARELPGKPDVVFRRRRKAIQVHGCFWHRHAGCRDCSVPRSRQEYWLPKFAATVARDERTLTELRAIGWDVLIVWDCETGDLADLEKRLVGFLGAPAQDGLVQGS
jgi:DNA mismatch endonuclease (patch repair protein)